MDINQKLKGIYTINSEADRLKVIEALGDKEATSLNILLAIQASGIDY